MSSSLSPPLDGQANFFKEVFCPLFLDKPFSASIHIHLIPDSWNAFVPAKMFQISKNSIYLKI